MGYKDKNNNKTKSQLDFLNDYIKRNKSKFEEFESNFDINEINYETVTSLFEGDRYPVNKKHEFLGHKIKIENIIRENIMKQKIKNYSSYIELIKLYSFYLCPKYKIDGLSTSQLRGIFDAIKKIHKKLKKIDKNDTSKVEEEINKLIKLRLNIAYQQGKNNENIIFVNFLETIDSFILKVNYSKDKINEVNNLYDFLEGIVCYLKYFNEVEVK